MAGLCDVTMNDRQLISFKNNMVCSFQQIGPWKLPLSHSLGAIEYRYDIDKYYGKFIK